MTLGPSDRGLQAVPDAFATRHGHVVAVGVGRPPHQLGLGFEPEPADGGLGGQNQGTGPLRQDEPGPVDAERPTGLRRILFRSIARLASQERLHRRETVDHRRRERTLAGTAEGQFGISRSQEHGPQDDRMPARGARVGRRGARAVEPEVLGDLAGRLVDDHRRDEIRAYGQAAAPDHPILLGLEQVQPAERRTDDDRGLVRVKLALEPVQPGVGPCLASRGHRQMKEPRRKLCDRRIFRRRARPEVLDHPAQVLKELVAAERRVAPNPGPTFDQASPGRVHVSTQAGHRGMSDNENPLRHPGLPIRPSKLTGDAQRRHVQLRRTASFIIFGKIPTFT